MTGTNCDLFTHKSSRSYLNHLVQLHVSKFISTALARLEMRLNQIFLLFFHDLLFTGILI
jgi:hypothetical protein